MPKITSTNQDAQVFFTANKHARIPNLDRQYSVQFIDGLYHLGADVKVSKVLNIENNILLALELIVCASYQCKKHIILELLKTNVLNLEEVKQNVFRVNWLNSP